MSVTAEAVKTLRERTGAGMMDCKRALLETGGDLEQAAELMRKTGLAKADKKAGRIAAEGVIAIERSATAPVAAIIEVNCETDFVAREQDFQRFATTAAQLALAQRATDVESVLAGSTNGQSIEETRRALVAKIGENISVRRVHVLTATGVLGSYLHDTRIGALVALKTGSEAVAKDIAMHVAAMNPAYLSAQEVPTAEVDKEREIKLAQMAEEQAASPKPPAIVAKIIEGKMRKWLDEITLLGQPFFKDPDLTVGKYLQQSGAEVVCFVRFEVGAGIVKEKEDYVAEVMKQVQGG